MVPGARGVLLFALLLLGAAVASPGYAATDGSHHPQVGGEDTPEVTMSIDLRENGDARWTITKRFDLSSDAERAAFDELATDFENGEPDADLGLDSFERASRLASESTGREMTITNVSRDTTRSDGTGELSLAFTWTSFGRVEDGRFYIDDVFTTDEGPWLTGLGENQRLVVQPPDGYEFFDASVPVTLRSGTIQWDGPVDFQPQGLSATFEESAGSSDRQSPNGTTNGTADGSGGTSPSAPWMGMLMLAGGVAVVGYLLAREEIFPRSGGEEPIEPTAEEAGDTAPGGDAEPEDETGIDEELLSDEERVERLLEANGGRMKQADIVTETGWSNAKVSQLLSSMAEDDRIDKLRIGRENLISFPDEDVTDFEDE